jgi:hypothetical protein
MDIVNFILFLVLPIVLFGGALVWAFGRQAQGALRGGCPDPVPR